jgi:hypothetical protein
MATTLTSDQSFALAQAFHNLAVLLGDYRFDNWDDLSPGERKQLEDLEFDILNDSTRFDAIAISGTLDNLDKVIDDIRATTERMGRAIETIEAVGDVFKMAAAAITLGAAIVSGNPEGIVSALGNAKKALG